MSPLTKTLSIPSECNLGFSYEALSITVSGLNITISANAPTSITPLFSKPKTDALLPVMR